MAIHSHDFVENYQGLVGYGLDRETDENTLIYYLQKFSDDRLIKYLIKKMSDQELDEVFDRINLLLKKYLSEIEYHSLFLKDDHH